MSNCIFIAADVPLLEHRPSKDYPIHFNLDTGEVFDGGADDNYSLLDFHEVDIYCTKKFGVTVELPQFTEGRAKEIISYIRDSLHRTDSVELWNMWLLEYWEYDDRPIIHTETIGIEQLSVSDMKRLLNFRNWEQKEPERAHFYCMRIIP